MGFESLGTSRLSRDYHAATLPSAPVAVPGRKLARHLDQGGLTQGVRPVRVLGYTYTVDGGNVNHRCMLPTGSSLLQQWQARLAAKFGFECTCRLCSLSGAQREASDVDFRESEPGMHIYEANRAEERAR